MSVKLNDILSYLKALAATMPGMHADRVHLSPLFPSQVSGANHIVISELRVPGVRIDGDKSVRELLVEIGVLTRIDPGSSTDADIQINATYEPLHAEFEKLVDGPAGGLFLTMEEDAEGPSTENASDERTLVRMKSCAWTIRYERATAGTD